VFYDLEFDHAVIEASFAMQYGIRLSKEDMPCGEFFRLLAGLMPETPLGRLVGIRMESRGDVLRQMSVSERRVRNEWSEFQRGGGRQPRIAKAMLVSAPTGELVDLQFILAEVFS